MIVAIILWIIILMFCVLILIKNEVTSVAYDIVIDAVYDYKIDCIYKDKEALVDYSDMNSYKKVLFNLFDWGITGVMPKEKLQIIHSYIRKDNKHER